MQTERCLRNFNYIDTLFRHYGKSTEVLHRPANDMDEMMQDFVSIITSFCIQLYGQRRSKRKTENIIAELKRDAKSA
jgi:predicted site-specific integrase-resolvase